jgi:2-polyprenyl-6-methoxyphenol hydroxylase-like FAD-dependent oxidoreductase
VGLRAGRCFGTPIAEYVPTRLVAGRVALVGDAAHVSSPMTGSGFHYSLLDVLSLRQALAGAAGGEAVAPALTQFERARLVDDRRLALYGQRWSRAYRGPSVIETGRQVSMADMEAIAARGVRD